MSDQEVCLVTVSGRITLARSDPQEVTWPVKKNREFAARFTGRVTSRGSGLDGSA